MTAIAHAATHDADLAAGIATLGIALDAAQRARLTAYLELLAKWNKTYNLTAIREPHRMVRQPDKGRVLHHVPAGL